MFNLEYVAASLGVNVDHGGLSLYESGNSGESITTVGSLTLTNTAVAFDGAMIGWYKKTGTNEDWTVATISGNKMIIPGSKNGDKYCVKYFYINENAKSITIKAQYVPKVLHLVLINDLYSGDATNVAASSAKYGRLITDIPQYQLNGGQNIAWSATSTATVSLSGSALAYDNSASCEEAPIYGTMTQEIFGTKWQDDVVAIAVDNGDVEIGKTDSETLRVRAVFGGNTASKIYSNDNFMFAVENTPTSTATDTTVDATGKITSGNQAGVAIVSVTLKSAPENVEPANVEPAYVKVTVSNS